MKVIDTDIDVRYNKPAESIEMHAHSGECKYCKGVVKMLRHPQTGQLQPNWCHCLLCGQPYFVEIIGSIKNWELNQWNQKGSVDDGVVPTCRWCGAEKKVETGLCPKCYRFP